MRNKHHFHRLAQDTQYLAYKGENGVRFLPQGKAHAAFSGYPYPDAPETYGWVLCDAAGQTATVIYADDGLCDPPF